METHSYVLESIPTVKIVMRFPFDKVLADGGPVPLNTLAIATEPSGVDSPGNIRKFTPDVREYDLNLTLNPYPAVAQRLGSPVRASLRILSAV